MAITRSMAHSQGKGAETQKNDGFSLVNNNDEAPIRSELHEFKVMLTRIQVNN